MADKKNDKKEPAKTTAAPEAPGQQPAGTGYGIQILAQYVRDMSLENPNAPESLLGGWGAPETGVQVNINTRSLKDDVHEVALMFRIEAMNKEKKKVTFIIEMTYAATVQLRNVPKEHVQPILMVEIPKLIFPFAREAVAHASMQGGYPPLYLQPMNFEAIFVAEAKRRAEEQKKAAG